MFIATISSCFPRDLIRKIVTHPLVSEVRFNTGIPSADSPFETLSWLKNICKKPLWIDLKFRQLKVEEWVSPGYAEIKLNQPVAMSYPAKVHLRGCGWVEINGLSEDGYTIYLESPPDVAIGKGQSANISAELLSTTCEFTESDFEYIKAAKMVGLDHFMISFFEGQKDLDYANELLGEDSVKCFKIESRKGAEYLDNPQFSDTDHVMVARDDLMINLEPHVFDIINIIEKCIAVDSNTIVASQIFPSLESGVLSACDISDLKLLSLLGCHRIMLSDELCLRHFEEVTELIPYCEF